MYDFLSFWLFISSSPHFFAFLCRRFIECYFFQSLLLYFILFPLLIFFFFNNLSSDLTILFLIHSSFSYMSLLDSSQWTCFSSHYFHISIHSSLYWTPFIRFSLLLLPILKCALYFLYSTLGKVQTLVLSSTLYCKSWMAVLPLFSVKCH